MVLIHMHQILDNRIFEPSFSDESEDALQLQDFNHNEEILSTLPTPYEIVYPEQYRKNKPLPLDTRDHSSKHQVRTISI